MKKKRLEQIAPLPATDEMLKLVREDMPEKKRTNYRYGGNITYYAYKRYIYFRSAPAEDGILLVAMYFRRELAAGVTEPYFHIFLDRDRQEFATYDFREEKWRSGMMESLYWDRNIREKGMEWENIPYADRYTTDMVNNYFGAEKQEVKKLINQFQRNVRKDKADREHKRETDEIDEAMALIPTVPGDFEEWIAEYGFYTSRYIFYHAEDRKKEKEAYCMQCGSSFKAMNPKRDKQYKCPVCRKQAFLKPWSSKNVREKVNVCLLQRLTDGTGWVTRRFCAIMTARKEENWHPHRYYTEEVREIYGNDFIQYGHYEYGQYRTTGIDRWCYTANESSRKCYYRDDYIMGEARVYWKNLRKERKGTILQYIPLEKALKEVPGTYMHIQEMMRTLREHPEVEYFIKMGFKNLSIDILQGRVELKPGKKPWEVLGVSKEIMQDALKYNVRARQLKTLVCAGRMGYRLTKKETVFFSTYFDENALRKIWGYATPHKMHRYFTEVLKTKKDIGDYMDYLEAAVINRYDMRNEMVLFPKHFRQAHDEAVEERLARERKIADMKDKQKNKQYAKMVPEIKALYEFENDEFFIKVPEKKSDFIHEGHMNNNCVGTYFDKVLNGRSVVVFLRKKELPDQAYCTVEITNVATLQQLRSRYNREAPPEAKEFAEKWMKEVRKRVAKKEAEEKKKRIQVAVAVG